MGIYQTLSEKAWKQRINGTIKRAKKLKARGKYVRAFALLNDLRNSSWLFRPDQSRFDEVCTLHEECECLALDQAIEKAEALMAKGKYEAARKVLKTRRVWDPWYRENEVAALIDRCERAMAGQPQETPAPTPEPKPAAPAPKPAAPAPKPKAEPKPAPAPKPAAKSAEELHDEAWACEQQDPARALRLYEQAAGMGYILSQYNCGMLYFEGVGCTRDYEKALDWFKEAATQGDADAQYMCGRTIHEIKKTYIGLGTMEAWDTQKVCTDAIWFWWKKAASQGHAEAQVALGMLYFAENDHETARYWLEKAVSQGNDEAKFWLEHLN